MYQPLYAHESGGKHNIRYILQAAGLVFRWDHLGIGVVVAILSVLIFQISISLASSPVGLGILIVISGVLSLLIGHIGNALIARSIKLELREGRRQTFREGLEFLQRNIASLSLYALLLVGLILAALLGGALLSAIGLIPAVGPVLYGMLIFPVSIITSVVAIIILLFLLISSFVFPAHVAIEETSLIETVKHMADLVRHRGFFIFGCQVLSSIVGLWLALLVNLVFIGGLILSVGLGVVLMEEKFGQLMIGMVNSTWGGTAMTIIPRDLLRMAATFSQSDIGGSFEIGGFFWGLWFALFFISSSSFFWTYMSAGGAMTYLATVQLPGAKTETGRQVETMQRDPDIFFGRLVDVGGAWDFQRLSIPAMGIRVGREQGCDIILTEEFVTISRKHTEIKPDRNGQICVQDLDSKNGTFVNGDLVTERELEPGDEIQLGNDARVTFRYEI
jgi:hypothetical protein